MNISRNSSQSHFIEVMIYRFLKFNTFTTHQVSPKCCEEYVACWDFSNSNLNQMLIHSFKWEIKIIKKELFVTKSSLIT